MTEAVIEVIEQINEVKAILFLNENFPPWLKEMCQSRIRSLQIKKKILETYKK